mgnify:CR=1 FL=1|jgi:hypothetical protein
MLQPLGITRGSVSLRAVRLDTDRPEAGGMAERAIRNKTQQNTGSVSLAANRGNILGIQYDTHNPATNATWTQRDKTAGKGYLMNNPAISTDGVRVYVPCKDNYSNDIAVEARVCGLVTETGNYRLTGNAFGEADTRYRNGEMHIVVVSNAYDYLVGPQTLSLNKTINSDWMTGETTHNYTMSLSTAKPYVTLTLRNVHKSGGAGMLTTHHFYNFVLKTDF